ncbi:cora-domain-containing protein [Coniochaeta ligniaria NRRL 30616]|uniref:Cora-domain-containing protein n=1 Tax=Coniochaeta ligniaria NRRL 30616 TaxID=1408157 RepID=A0A1J7JYG0_9PEZI|nr:cora-domain-containing protein [Coniochaeta ligniaria NRRL 30616]
MDSGRPNLAGGTDGPSGSTRPQANAVPPRRRKNHRGGKKKKSRRKSFVAPSDDLGHDSLQAGDLEEIRENFYAQRGGNNSQTSLESEVLLDHREQNPFLRPRRPSTLPTSAPLLSSSGRMRSEPAMESGGYGSNSNETAWRTGLGSRRDSSHASSRRKHLGPFAPHDANYNVNYPPSVPGSPSLRPTDMSFGDVMLRDDLARSDIPHSPRESVHRDGSSGGQGSKPQPSPLERRNTFALQAEEDVCFPHEGMSEIAEEDLRTRDPNAFRMRTRRRRHRWPDLSILEEWGRFEKEGRSEERRAKKITEPQLINGRLRPTHKGWYRTEEDAPYRFTYFNEEFQSTIHSSTISELVQPGGSFKELFIPDPPILSDSSDSESDDERDEAAELHQVLTGQNGDSKTLSHQPSLAQTTQGYFDSRRETKSPSHDTSRSAPKSKENSGDPTPAGPRSPNDLRSPQQKPKDSPRPNGSPPRPKSPKPPRYGDRPVWWLDVLCPTEQEMKVLSKAFAIHPLTSEDIMMQEAREKVELFRHYYFVNYRTFEQDKNKENFLEPVNMYVVVFREGVLSFHFSHTPHPANVRRRIRQLQDYMILSADWISYAIIDDITDVFFPLIQNIEDDVDDIDDAILQLHSSTADPTPEPRDPEKSPEQTGGDMLRRVGDCRKKVMGLYRLLGNKADVIKGFAKRCNEHWEVAPRSEIGLYLGDIQDHIVTMTANLSHYEKILARSHANYLAQINIRMNERQEQTADVLGRLTVLGTIVLPMNIITGLWGMNVWVPGQGYEEDLRWFIAITGGLIAFGIACYLVAKRVYGIV